MVSSNNRTVYSATGDGNIDDHHTRHGYVPPKDAIRRCSSDEWDAEDMYPTSSTSPVSTEHGGWSEENIPPSQSGRRQLPQVVKPPRPPIIHHRTYDLVVAQQPQTTAECGQHDMSRLPLSPPLFVRLVVRNSVGAEVSAYVLSLKSGLLFTRFRRDAELPFLVARITLHSAGSPHSQDLSSSTDLYGTTISGPHSLRDLDGVPGAYFVFPDVGVRRQGQWRLYVSLLRIARVGSATVFGHGDASSCLVGVWTDVFDVVSAGGYVAPERTPLTWHFQSQGVRMYTSNSALPR